MIQDIEKRIEDIICETQGEIFKCANEMKLDMDIFVPKYMKSRFCEKNMDTIYSYYQMIDGEISLYYILQEIEVPILKEAKYNSVVMDWIGFIYRRIYYAAKKNSKEIIEKAPFNAMLIYYPGLHTVDEDMAVDIIIEDKF
ncbi:MAG: hypothetical protein IKN12_02335 [Selenomonadaceae bacterium]|nr:hypothetical protein [Selenomonadaceae bacterium]